MKLLQFKDLWHFQRAAYIMLFVFWLSRGYQGIWLSQLAMPPFICVQADSFYWLFHLLGLPQFFLQHYFAALSLDISISILLLLLMYKVHLRWAAVLYFFAFLCYFITYHSASLHHTHSIIPALIFALLLCIKTVDNWDAWHKAVRYYACGAMVFAALWKLFRGTAFDIEQMANILQNQHEYLFYTKAGSFYANVYNYLIANKSLSFLLLQSAFWLEFSFIIGFFSRKYDTYLAVALVVFIIADYFVMSLYFFEFAMFVFCFATLKKDEKKEEV